MRKLMFILSLALTSLMTHAQDSIKVAAIVTDALTGKPLPYVHVQTAGGNETITNHDGEFLINANEEERLFVSCVGYEQSEVTANQVDTEIALQPFTRQPTEFDVNKDLNILHEITNHNLQTCADQKEVRSDYFYRQIMHKYNTIDELTEAIFEGNGALGLSDLRVVNGRYGGVPLKDDQKVSAYSSNEYFRTFWNYCENHLFMPILRNISHDDFMTPLVLDSINYYMNNYDVRTERLVGKNGKSILVFHFRIKNNPISQIIDGDYYFDEKTHNLLQVKGKVHNMSFTTFNVWQYYNRGITWRKGTLDFTINYTQDRGFSEVESMGTSTRVQSAACQSVMFKIKKKYFHTKPSKMRSDELRMIVDKKGIDDNFWNKNEIVKRTTFEDITLWNMMENETILPGDITSDVLMLQKYATNIMDSNIRLPQEDILLRTDQMYYQPGDTIWFSAELMYTGIKTTSRKSGIIYFELLDKVGAAVKRARLDVPNGNIVSTGITLPVGIPEGLYRLQACTQYQMYWGKHDAAEVRIIVGEQDAANLSALERERLQRETAPHNDGGIETFGAGQKSLDASNTSPLLYTLTNSGNVVEQHINKYSDFNEGTFNIKKDDLPDGYNRISVIDGQGRILRDTLIFKEPQRTDAPTYCIMSPQGEPKPFEKVVVEVFGKPNTSYLLCVTDSAHSISHNYKGKRNWLLNRGQFHADGRQRYDLNIMMGKKVLKTPANIEVPGFSNIIRGRIVDLANNKHNDSGKNTLKHRGGYPILRIQMYQSEKFYDSDFTSTDSAGNFHFDISKFKIFKSDMEESRNWFRKPLHINIISNGELKDKRIQLIDNYRVKNYQGIDCNQVVDSLLEIGEDVPGIEEYLKKYDRGFYESTPLPSNKKSEKQLLHKDGMKYGTRPVVWIVDGEVGQVTGIPADMTMIGWNPKKLERLMPKRFTDVYTINIQRDFTDWEDYDLPAELIGRNPVVVEMNTCMRWSEDISGSRHICHELMSENETFFSPKYENARPEYDIRRTLYWNPNVKTDENGRATVTFYNNEDCKKFSIRLE